MKKSGNSYSFFLVFQSTTYFGLDGDRMGIGLNSWLAFTGLAYFDLIWFD